MLTGDNRTTAGPSRRKLGITEIEAEVLPEQKNAVVRRLRSEGRVVAMAGDGVNDAPALAEADVGIAMGTGTDVAMQSAGMTLVKGDLAGIARAGALSRATMRNIRQNLVLAFVYNMLGVPLAAGVLYPAFGLLLSPIVAARGHELQLGVGRSATRCGCASRGCRLIASAAPASLDHRHRALEAFPHAIEGNRERGDLVLARLDVRLDVFLPSQLTSSSPRSSHQRTRGSHRVPQRGAGAAWLEGVAAYVSIIGVVDRTAHISIPTIRTSRTSCPER